MGCGHNHVICPLPRSCLFTIAAHQFIQYIENGIITVGSKPLLVTRNIAKKVNALEQKRLHMKASSGI